MLQGWGVSGMELILQCPGRNYAPRTELMWICCGHGQQAVVSSKRQCTKNARAKILSGSFAVPCRDRLYWYAGDGEV